MKTSYIGTIHSGLGTAKDYVAKNYYFTYFTGFLGQEPFLGTLNIHLNLEDLDQYYDAVKTQDVLVIPGLHSNTEVFWGISCYFVSINRLSSKSRGQRCLALNFDRPEHPANIIEVIAGSNLRARLKLENGMKIVISFTN